MKRLERTRNTARNLIWGIVNKCVSLFLPFFIRVIIIQVLGKEYLGLNNLFVSVLSVLNLAELGLGSAMVYSMYKPIAEENKELICSLLAFYKKMYRIISIVVLIIGIAIYPFLPYIIKDEVEGVNTSILYFIFLFDTIISYLLFAYKNSLLLAHQRTDISSNIGTIIHFGLNITQVVLLLLFKNYYIFILAKPLFTILNNLSINYVSKKYYPNYKAQGSITKQQSYEIFKRVKALAGHKIGATVIASADSLVISAVLGLDVVAIFSNYYYIVFFVISLTAIFFDGMLAGIGNSLIVESKETNYILFKNINFILSWLVSWCSVCLLCLFQPFMEVWMGKDMLLSTSSLILIVIYYYSWQFRTTGLYFKDAAGMWNQDFWKPYVSAVSNLIINIILINLIGINGVFISTIVCMLCINFPWETKVIFKDLFNRSPKEYLFSELINLLKTLFICLVTYFICSIIPIQHGIICIIIRLLVCCVVPNLLFLLFSYKKKELPYVISRFKMLTLKRMEK